DLLMFCHVDKGSVKTLKEAIEVFGSVLGLKPNYDKSTIIFGSIKKEDRQDILDCVTFKTEKLLIRVLINSGKEDVIVWKAKNGKESLLKQLTMICEINWRLFRDEKRSLEVLLKCFEDVIRMRLMSLRVKNSEDMVRVQQNWNLCF
nr:RNA-directed DNA polymerase, eukaryota, reverse transcriptase zinc-binding domain protein [Tanacetum cinerariifolium]